MPPRPEEWAELLGFSVLEANYGLPQGLLTAVVRQESRGNPRAQNVRSGAQGLFQFMPDTARAYKADPYNPLEAAPAAAEELGKLYKKYDADLQRTLAGWNWGQGRVDRLGMGKAPAETREFMAKVGGEVLGEARPSAAGRAQPFQTSGAMPAREKPLIDVADFQAWLAKEGAVSAPPTATAGAPDAGGAPRPLDAPMQPVSPEDAAALRADSQLTVEIAKPSPAAAPDALPPGRHPSQDEIFRRIDAGVGDAQAQHEAGLQQLPGMALPIVGGVAGAALGGLTSPVTGPAGPIVGSVIGQGLGTRAASALGLTEPETPLVETPVAHLYPSDVLSAALPAVGGIAKRVLPKLPGASPVMHELAGEQLEQLPKRLGPSVPSEHLFAQAAHHNPAIVPVSITQTARDLLARERALPASLQNREVQRVAGDMLTLSAKPGASIPLQQLDAIRQRVGLLIRQANTENWPQATGLRATYRSIMDDLGTAAQQGVPGAQPLMQALGAHRQERAMEGLTDLWSPGKGLQLEAGDITHVYGKRIQNQFEKRLADDKLFAGSFTPDELVDIRETLRDVARLTSRSPTDSGNWVGQGVKWLGRLAGLTEAVGGNVPGAVGLTIAAEAAPAVIAAAMQSSMGRAALRLALADGNGTLTAAGLRSLASVTMRTQLMGEPHPDPAAPQQ